VAPLVPELVFVLILHLSIKAGNGSFKKKRYQSKRGSARAAKWNIRSQPSSNLQLNSMEIQSPKEEEHASP
jgi:hypothetical protein